MSTRAGIIGKGSIVALLFIAAVAGSASYVASTWEHKAQQQLVRRTLSNVYSNMAAAPVLDEVYTDADGDLIADLPEQEALIARPAELVFSFIASVDPANEAEVWKVATDAISAKVGLPVRYLQLEDTKSQLAALRSGHLHVTAFSSGTVPTAINHAGFAPFCTLGSPEGEYGYTMQFIVKADSPIKDLGALRDKKIAFVRPRSNSGCKVPMILLLENHNMQLERDYRWYYSYSHNESISDVVEGKADAAPVASDVLERMVSKGNVAADAYRVIYESERFPPVAFGCAHNLAAEIREGIEAALLELDWSDSRLAEELGAGEVKKFLPIAYKDDWANIRRVDQAANNVLGSIR